MMRLIFVNRFYWPETPATGQLLTDLAESLAAEGHDTTVVTSGDGKTSAEETHHGVKIRRLTTTRSRSGRLASKAIDFATFHLRAMACVFRLARRNTIIVSLTDPPLLGIGLAFIARLRGAQLVHWIHDIYPELAIELAGAHWLRLTRPLRNAAWRRALRCVTLGEDMALTVRAGGVDPAKLAIIPNWAPASVAEPPREKIQALRAEWCLRDKFVVAYSGNLGRVHDLEPILEIADALRAEARIAFLFVGDGPQRAALQAEVTRRDLANVTFHPPQPRAALAETLAIADLHLVTLRPGCERLVFPSKLYGILAVNCPVLFIGPPDCEIARLVASQGFGLIGQRERVSEMVDQIRALAIDPARIARWRTAATRFATEHTCATSLIAWRRLFESLEAAVPNAKLATTGALR